MVFRDQNCFRATHFPHIRRWHFRLHHSSRQGLEIHPKQTSLPRFAVHVQKSSVLLDDSIHRRQPQPCSFSLLLGGKKRLEDSFQRRRVHSHSGIRNRQHRVPPWCNSRITTRVRTVHADHPGLNQQPAARWHGVPRVDTQVHQHLLH